MKWYFACNENSQDFFPLIKGAVNSALQNTTLEPIFIYDGKENELTGWLKENGVKIINHRVSFYEALEKYYQGKGLDVASGAFLRCDIPVIEKDDEYVLYTDCDVLFLKDFKPEIFPKYFACAPQSNKRNFLDFNTGVMLMNVKNLRETHEKFCDFIVKNLNLLSTFDQTAYQIFYGGKWGGKWEEKLCGKCTKLPVNYNHKPYWGIDDSASIIHFHGAKPTIFTSEETLKSLPYSTYNLYKKSLNAYDFYLNLFKKYYPEIPYDYDAIDKLKKGIYPLVKPKKNPLKMRISNKILKTKKQIEQYLNICK